MVEWGGNMYDMGIAKRAWIYRGNVGGMRNRRFMCRNLWRCGIMGVNELESTER